MKNGIRIEPDKVWVTLSATLNLGNYESVKIETGFSETIVPGSPEPVEMIEAMCTDLRTELHHQALRLKKEFSSKTRTK